MNMHEQISRFCAQIGANPLLVQGAGGNVSWKDSEVLWIKASGTWLKEALERDIFVPVDLIDLGVALKNERFDATPKVIAGAVLRPSIETVLHALLPQRVVVHVHAIDALAWLVRTDPWPALQSRLSPRWKPCFVPYRKPGAELARVIAEAVSSNPTTQLVCMANHGVVIAADTLDEVQLILEDTITALRVMPLPLQKLQPASPIRVDEHHFLHAVPLEAVQGQDLSAQGLSRMADAWALYPDHVVFLGAEPICHSSSDEARQFVLENPTYSAGRPHFIRDQGVFSLRPLSVGQLAQLRCYVDVMQRQHSTQALQVLSRENVQELLDWDAEKYRRQLDE
ncbi:MAG: class II aldolase/adducin family protein [Aquabacterium sp.]|jgi:rhamnose utilization protein RhaD (predicted bifunctional aldolase and dehydrogenase)|uniref:class II aldolase/adducin family protein n=1 Tax=Aquabacterium sp. TaxID=1872578 RepID=UPI002A3629D9|nr:class II aldolase/adducin family protein [Aquabacterium sp.]MDX9845235.1 class II aldolase/adducin family protein [Aquabacterium sp.]